jgi:curved DNA-binding protein
MDYYNILGVNRQASQDDIKRAYRQLAKQHHPDSGGDIEQFKKINEAYSIIGDEQKRHVYNHAPSGSRNANSYEFNSQDATAFNDLFKDIFGASAGFHHSRHIQPKNKDLKVTIIVDLSSIVESQQKTLHLKTGRSERTVEVDIPAGVNNGATIRYRGYGQDILTRVPPGDLLVSISVKDIENFKRNGADIYSNILVDAIDAMLGTIIEVTNLDGNKINVNIPSGTQHGQILRIAGRGLPKVNSPNLGNLMLVVMILIPKDLNDEQKKLLTQLKLST